MGEKGKHRLLIHSKGCSYPLRLLRLREDLLNLRKLCHFPEMLFHLVGICLNVKPAKKILELQPLEQGMSFRGIKVSPSGFLQVKGNVRVCLYGCQDLAQLSLVPVFFQIFAGPWRLDLIHMGVSIFQRMIFLYDLGGRLLSHPRNPGDIVGSVPHQGFHIDEFLRCNSIPLLHLICVVVLHLGPSLLCLGDPDLHMLCGKLQGIPVSRDNGHVKALLLTAPGQGPQKVVRLKAGLLEDLHSHGP